MLVNPLKKKLTKEVIYGLLVLFFITACQGQKTEKSGKEEEIAPPETEQIQAAIPTNAEVNDQEVEKFISLNMEIRKNQQKFRQQFMQMIQESTIDAQKFQEMAQVMNNPNSTEQGSFSDAEMQAYNKLNTQLEQIQQTAMAESQEIIQASSMAEPRFEAISGAARQDTALQMRLQQEMMKQMQMNMPQQQTMPGGGAPQQ
jgi:Mg-chelatase subunit ChlI